MAHRNNSDPGNEMSKGDDGYTIVEALCAFAILAIGLTALYGAAGPIVGSIDRVSNMQSALLFAQSKLDEIAVSNAPLASNASGHFENTNISWTIATRDVSSLRDKQFHVTLQDVHLSLTWPSGLRTQSLSFDTRHLGVSQP